MVLGGGFHYSSDIDLMGVNLSLNTGGQKGRTERRQGELEKYSRKINMSLAVWHHGKGPRFKVQQSWATLEQLFHLSVLRQTGIIILKGAVVKSSGRT